MTFCQVGGGTLVVEPGEGRDPLTVNDQVALNSFKYLCLARGNLCQKSPSNFMDLALIDLLGEQLDVQVVTKVLGVAECWLLLLDRPPGWKAKVIGSKDTVEKH